MNIPKSFKIANQTINIVVEDELSDGEYGYFEDPSCTIKIAKTVDGIELSEEQMMNTLYHEIIHAFQFFFNNNYDEAQAQCFSNFLREFESTKQF